MYNSSKNERSEGRSRKPFYKGTTGSKWPYKSTATAGRYKTSGYRGASTGNSPVTSPSTDRRGGFKSAPSTGYKTSGYKGASRPQSGDRSSYRGGSTSFYRSGTSSTYRGTSSAPSSYRSGSRPQSGGSSSYRGGSSPSYAGGRSSGGRPSYGGDRRSSGSRGGSRSPLKRRFQGKYISTDKFINKNPKNKAEDKYIATHTFADFGFDSDIVNNLTKKGYTHPTRIQDESIPHLIAGRNVIGLANTGSGKTAAFLLPIIQKLKNTKGTETALIVAPTRELANQIEDELKIFAQGMRIFSALCVGGMSISFQKRQLSRKPQIIIGTPGRLKDLFNQRALNLKTATFVVLDEADRMLDMGFLKDIEFLISQLSTNPQALCFSATITPDISRIIDKIFPNPVTISARTSESGEHIAQDVIKVTSGDHKIDQLLKMLAEPHFEKVLIFGEMKHSVQKLADTLTQKGFPAEAIHGNKTQAQRNRSLAAFKNGKVNILVATDVAARGLDIPNVSHVINFDKPNTYEDYIHRIGRTGRAGKDGQAYTFIHD